MFSLYYLLYANAAEEKVSLTGPLALMDMARRLTLIFAVAPETPRGMHGGIPPHDLAEDGQPICESFYHHSSSLAKLSRRETFHRFKRSFAFACQSSVSYGRSFSPGRASPNTRSQ